MVGSDQTRNPILDTRGNPQTRKTRNGASVRDEGMFNHGEDAKVRAENTTEAFRGISWEKGTLGTIGSYDNIASRTRKHTNDKWLVSPTQEIPRLKKLNQGIKSKPLSDDEEIGFSVTTNVSHFYLQSEYGSSKMYPIFPRYTMLKDMIKDVMHDPR